MNRDRLVRVNYPANLLLACALNGVFMTLTVGSSVFILFLDALQFDRRQIGMIMALLPFCGLVAIAVAPTAARFGYKRTHLTFLVVRALVFLAILLTPWMMRRGGGTAAFYFVASLMLLFAVCKAIAETAYYPWLQEVIPSPTRGKLDGLLSIVTAGSIALAMATTGVALGAEAGIDRFMMACGVGVAFGLAATFFMSQLSGGEPVRSGMPAQGTFRQMQEVMGDRNFVRFLLGQGLLNMVVLFLVTFIPVYARQVLGLRVSAVIALDVSTLIGGVLTFYLWGWMGDRYGSRPINLVALSLTLVVPMAWMALPRSFATGALCIAFLWGVCNAGLIVSNSRLLNVNLVPPEKRGGYMALNCAVLGLSGGLALLLGGWALERLRGVNWSVGRWWSVDSFVLLFGATFMMLVIALSIFKGIRTVGEMPTRKFLVQILRVDTSGVLGVILGKRQTTSGSDR